MPEIDNNKKSLEHNIYILMEGIRDLTTEIQNILLKDNKKWNQMCSSMDVIEDTQGAMDSYLTKTFPEEIGEQYLFIYGVFQVLYVQQDAITHLIESLDLSSHFKTETADEEELKKIRCVRNDSTGHPTNRNFGKSFHFISQPTMEKKGFQLMKSIPNEATTFHEIETIELINKQAIIIEKTLKDIIEELKKRFNLR